MAIKYGFFNSVNGDRKYTAAEIGDYLRGIIYSGVYPDGASSLQVLAAGGMVVEVQPGRAMLEFKYLENDAPYQITLSAGGTMDRIDAIVAFMDLNERACGIAVKQGTPAAAPVAPAMTRTDVRYEVMLASVYVTRLVNEVTQANITDTRHLTEVCGWVRGAIRQDTVDIPLPTHATAGHIPRVTQDGKGYELLPAYGLGRPQFIEWSDVDNITTNGWYCAIVNGEIVPSAPTYMAWIRVDGLDTNYACQTAYLSSAAFVLERHMQNGVWGAWCWKNPPMHPGVEYRTTEMYAGQPVYTMLFNTGELADGGTFTYTSVPVNVCRYAASIDSSALPIYALNSWNAGWSLRCDVNGQKVTAYMGANRATAAIDVQVWYTKY